MGRERAVAIREWQRFVAEYPDVVPYTAYDFPQGGTWGEYKAWLDSVMDEVRGDPEKPGWYGIFAARVYRPRDRYLRALWDRLIGTYKKYVYTSPEKVWETYRTYDMYVFPPGYAFVLPHLSYGWGFFLGNLSGVGYLVAKKFVVHRIPMHVRVTPIVTIKDGLVPYQTNPGGRPPLSLRGLPSSDQYRLPGELFSTAAFAMRPFGVEPDGSAVVGYRVAEQVFPLGKLGKEVFISPECVPVLRILFRLSAMSLYLSRQIFDRAFMGSHRRYNALARIDYAYTMYHAIMLADLPAYRAAIEKMYQLGEISPAAPEPSHRFVFRVTGSPDQLSLVMSDLPAYAGPVYFPEVRDWYEISPVYKD